MTLFKQIYFYFREFIGYYSPYYFGSNGHWYLMRVLQDRCNVTEKELQNPSTNEDKCKGFKIYPKNYFYAIDWADWLTAFEPINHAITTRFMDTIKDSYIVHFTNPKSQDQKVKINSDSGYELLFKKFCPKVYSTLTEDF